MVQRPWTSALDEPELDRETLATARAEPESGSPSASEPGERRSKLYDFRRPDKFSKEHLRALQTLHESFARLAGSTLSSYLRSAVRINLLSVDQVLYDEFLERLPNPSTVHVIHLDPLPGRALLEINMQLALSMIDRVLGGAGKSLQRVREITEIELTLLQRLVSSLLTAYQEAWVHLEAVRPRLVDVVLNPQYIQSALPGDAAVMLQFELRMGGQTHTFNLCLPYGTLEPVAGKLTTRIGYGVEHQSSQEELHIEQRMMHIAVPFVAVLGRARVHLRDLLGLEVGHIIPLDSRAQQPLEIVVDNGRHFLGVPGLVGRHLAVRISEVCAEVEQDDGPERKISVL